MRLANVLAYVLVALVAAACGPTVFVSGDPGPFEDGAGAPGDPFGDVGLAGTSVGPWTPLPGEPQVDGGIRGMVYRDDGGETRPVAGARVSLVTDDGARVAVSDATGRFTFDASPGAYIAVVEADGFWGVARTIAVPADGPLELDWPMRTDDVAMKAIADHVGLPFDSGAAVVSVWFTGARGGETVRLTSSSSPPITFDADHEPVVSDALLPTGVPMITFGDVEPGAFVVHAVAADDATRCAVARSPAGAWPALAHVLTYVQVRCSRRR